MKRILYLQYTNPAFYPSLEHGAQLLAAQGWQVLFLGIGGLSATSFRLQPHANIRVRELPPPPSGWRLKLHYLWFCLWALAWTLRWRPSWIYASDLLACPVALLLSSLTRVPVLYHEHDTPLLGGRSRFVRLCLWARRRLAQRARLCVIPNHQRRELFSRQLANGRPVLTAWNCPTLEEVASLQREPRSDTLLLHYHGSIGASWLRESMLKALALLPEGVRLEVVGYEALGAEGYTKALREMARRVGISERVEFLGWVPTRGDLLWSCTRCDVGLALISKVSDDINLQHMLGASNKPFDYLACGLALLVADLPDWRATYVEPGYGLACDPDHPESIAEALHWFMDHPTAMREMGEKGRQRILAEWNYERQFQPVMEHIQRGLAR